MTEPEHEMPFEIVDLNDFTFMPPGPMGWNSSELEKLVNNIEQYIGKGELEFHDILFSLEDRLLVELPTIPQHAPVAAQTTKTEGLEERIPEKELEIDRENYVSSELMNNPANNVFKKEDREAVQGDSHNNSSLDVDDQIQNTQSSLQSKLKVESTDPSTLELLRILDETVKSIKSRKRRRNSKKNTTKH